MAENKKQPLVGHGAPFFEWSPGVPIPKDVAAPLIQETLDPINTPPDTPDEPLFGREPDGEEPEPDDEQGPEAEPTEEDPQHGEMDHAADNRSADGAPTNDAPTASDNNLDEQRSEIDATEHMSEPDDVEEPWSESDYNDGTYVPNSETDESLLADPELTDEEPEADDDDNTARRHNLRPNRTRDYSHRLGHVMDKPASGQSYDAQLLQHEQPNNDDEPTTLREAVQEMQRTGANHDVLKCLTGIMMTQMSAKAGIKKHGQVAIDALFEEFAQLHDLGVFEPQQASKLSSPERRAALRAISVVKEKRCGRIKGRTVADGRPQRKLYTKDETSSPTVSTDALMLSLLIGAHERRDVAVADVTGAYLHAHM
jgi:hypothetical protein